MCFVDYTDINYQKGLTLNDCLIDMIFYQLSQNNGIFIIGYDYSISDFLVLKLYLHQTCKLEVVGKFGIPMIFIIVNIVF